MLQKITVKININKYTGHSPNIQEHRIWAWVCDGWALHHSVGVEFTRVGNTVWHPGWTITHVASGLRLPRHWDRKDALRVFRGLRDVQVSGRSLVDMTPDEMSKCKDELKPQLHELFCDPNAIHIGGSHQ